MAKEIGLFLLALAIGYFVGFTDGRHHTRNIILRAVDRVAGVAENTVGERERKLKEELGEMDR